ncbi:hypothetical protein B0F90DRAFT_1235948 [Multifurca ochricompacta]|uniref:C3H1-type domain-containing protein n=1 Tax=Multifurca ochricompacta TaxID=376703 RepID=A0AAD4QNS3_9AGAM|nr:hypothetical protein B0F90DRAFT_1235948 [Multifurca ochricompacta]
MLLPPLSSRRPVSLAVPPTSVSSEDLAQLIFRNGYSSPASDAPSLSDGDSEPPSAAWEAPELSERWPCSPPAPSPVVYYNPTPGLFSPGVPFMHPAFGPQASLKQATRTELRRPSMSARKLKALKTKQCKFFKKDGHCPQGSLCTFIHDPSAIQGYPPTQEPLLDSAGPSTQPSSRLGSEIDEERERNIYPITWRVIGGGVMMGGQREVCKSFIDGNCPEGDDCSNAHPTTARLTLETDIDDIHDIHDIEIPIDTPSSPIATPRASDIPLEQTHVTKQLEMAATPVSELLPDISPIVLRRGCEPLSFLSVKEELPPRPFSTPPRLSSRKANSMEWSAF